MPAESDLIFVVSYPCPHCKSSLESPADQPGTWIRCPKCGRASRAPEALFRRPPDPVAPGEDVLRIQPAPEPKPMTPVAFAPVRRNSREPGVEMVRNEPAPAWRVACGAVLFLAVVGLLFSFVEKNEVGIIACGVVGLIALIALLRGGSS